MANLRCKVQQLWSLLDELAESDYDEYKKFIETNIKKGKAFFEPPKFFNSLKTKCSKQDSKYAGQTFYINTYQWNRIPPPQTQDQPIPILGSPILDCSKKAGADHYIAIAVNSASLHALIRDEKQAIELIVDFLRELNDVILDKSSARLVQNSQSIQDLVKGGALALQNMVHGQQARLEAKLPKGGLSSNFPGETESLIKIDLSKGDQRKPHHPLIEEVLPNMDFELKEIAPNLAAIKVKLNRESSAKSCNLIWEKNQLIVQDEGRSLAIPIPETFQKDPDVTARYVNSCHCLFIKLMRS